MNTARSATVFAAVAVAVISAFAYQAESGRAQAPAANIDNIPRVTIVAKRLTPAEKQALLEQENLQASRARRAEPRA